MVYGTVGAELMGALKKADVEPDAAGAGSVGRRRTVDVAGRFTTVTVNEPGESISSRPP